MLKKRLGEMLLEAGAIDEAQLQAALGHQRKWGGKLGQALLDLRLTTEAHIVSALSRKFGYEAVSVASLPRTPQLDAALKLVPRELALRQMLLPIASDNSSIQVAMADPSNIAVIDELAFRTGRRVKVVLAGDREVAAAVRRLYFPDEAPLTPTPPLPAPPTAPSETPLPGRLVTTTDPFAAMPDYIREGYFNRPAHTLSPEPSAGAAALPRGSTRVESFSTGPLPEEPVLLTELAPSDEDELQEAPPAERSAVLRRSALADALDHLAHGEQGTLEAGQLAVALARLMLRHGLITESELLETLSRR